MKLKNKTLWTIVLLGGFIVALAGIGAAYLGQTWEQEDLSQQLASTSGKLTAISVEPLLSQQSEIRDRLVQYEADILDTRTQLSPSLVDADIYEKLYAIAGDAGIQVATIASNGQTTAVVDKITYNMMSLSVSVRGDVANIHRFILGVGSSFKTGVLEPVQIASPGVTAGGSSEQSAADIKLNIYSYRGQ